MDIKNELLKIVLELDSSEDAANVDIFSDRLKKDEKTIQKALDQLVKDGLLKENKIFEEVPAEYDITEKGREFIKKAVK